LVLILPVKEAEVKTEIAAEDKVGDDEQTRDEDKVEDDDQANVEENQHSGHSWGDLGPGFEVQGETSFLAVRRKEVKVFDLVNLDWYRSSNASSDSDSSTVDLWDYFRCEYSNQDLYRNDVGQSVASDEVIKDVIEEE
jgi:hypothetical protein